MDIALERTPALINQALRGPIDALIRQDLRRREVEAEAALSDNDDAPDQPPDEQTP